MTPGPIAPTAADVQADALRAILVAHRQPMLGQGLGQIASTFVPFFALLAAMYGLATISPWLSLLLTIPAAGLVVRIFIIQHDCGHGAFFRSRAANAWLGRFCGVITMTPFANWRRQHALHHAVWNNLDRRTGLGDIYSTCMTVAEYRALSAAARIWHRAVRHPAVAQVLLPPLVFLLLYRVPFDTPLSWRREWYSVFLNDAAIVAVLAALTAWFGFGPVALVHFPIVALAAIIGMWIFSVQHRFEGAVWSRQDGWTASGAALQGTSHLKLPRILQWFSGNIGFHHIHHLTPLVPNYRLEDCHRACAPILTDAPSLTLGQALRAPSYALWDEETERMVRFCDLPSPARGNAHLGTPPTQR